MSTVITPEISSKNKYWISKHRYYELKHFCLQYFEWKEALSEMGYDGYTRSLLTPEHGKAYVSPTENFVVRKDVLINKITIVEQTAEEADPYLCKYILKAVTCGYSFPYLKTCLDMPCCKDMYYDRYRKFFWLLDKKLSQ